MKGFSIFRENRLRNHIVFMGSLHQLIKCVIVMLLFTCYAAPGFSQIPEEQNPKYVFHDDTTKFTKQLSVGLSLVGLTETIATIIEKGNNEVLFVNEVILRQTLTPFIALQGGYFRRRSREYWSNGFNHLDYRINMGKFKVLFTINNKYRKRLFYELGVVGLLYHSKEISRFEAYDMFGGRFAQINKYNVVAGGNGFSSSANIRLGKSMLRLECEIGRLFKEGDGSRILYHGVLGRVGFTYIDANIEFYYPIYKYKTDK
jgi:hypothetical protein